VVVDVLVEVVVDVLVLVVVLVDVLVVLVVLVDVLVVVVVKLIGIRSYVSQTPVDTTLIVVAESGTDTRYPASIVVLDIPVATGTA
jgi:hypothetical protein